jgi:hypothetical protein
MAEDAANVGVPGQYDALVVFAFIVAFADSYGIGVLRTRERQRESVCERERGGTKTTREPLGRESRLRCMR